MVPSNNSPLKGVKVLDFSQLLPGPLCSQHLADMGAEVIKVENPRVPDGTRFLAGGENHIPYMFLLLNRNKKAITINLKRKDGQDIIRKLLKDTDILLEGFRPGAMAKMNLSYELLKDEFPSLIYASISGYGQVGDYANLAGHDANYISYSGILSLTGTEEAPVLPGVQIADIGGGTLTALSGILAALYFKEKTGKGQYLDVSMADGALSFLHLQLAWYLNNNKDLQRGKTILSGGLANYNIYKSSDNKFIMFAALEERFLRSFLRSQSKEDLLAKIDFTRLEKTNDMLASELKKLFSSHPFTYWEKLFSNPDTCLSPILNLSDVLENQNYKQRKMLPEREHPLYGKYRDIASPFHFSECETTHFTPAPEHSQHTEEILSKYAYSKDRIAELKRKKII